MLSDVTGVTPLRSRGAFQISVAANASTGVSGRDYLLVAPSDTERKAWMEAVQRAMLAPSRAALVLRQTTELQRRGQLCSRESEVIRAWLMSGRDEDVECAVDLMGVAAGIAPGERGSDRLESLLVDFRIADTEGELLRVLQSLKTVLEEEDTTGGIRDRIMDVAMRQYSSSTERLSRALESQRAGSGGGGGGQSGDASGMSGEGGGSASSAAHTRTSSRGRPGLFSRAAPTAEPAPAAAARPGVASGAADSTADAGSWGTGARRRNSPALSLYGGVSGTGTSAAGGGSASGSGGGGRDSAGTAGTSGASVGAGGGSSSSSGSGGYGGTSIHVQWSGTVQDMFSLVLHTIAMRVHARETGEGMGTLLAQPGRDGGEEAAAAATVEAAAAAAAEVDATGIDAAAAADVQPAVPLPEGIDAKAAPATDPTDPLAYLRESTRVTADYHFGACGSEGAVPDGARHRDGEREWVQYLMCCCCARLRRPWLG
jgi:hypothetical protein